MLNSCILLMLLLLLSTEITEVNLSAFVYSLFRDDFSSIYRTQSLLYIYVVGPCEARLTEHGISLGGVRMQGVRMTAVQRKNTHGEPLCQTYSFIPYLTQQTGERSPVSHPPSPNQSSSNRPSSNRPMSRSRRYSTLIGPDLLTEKTVLLPSEKTLKTCLDIAMENTMKSQTSILIAGMSDLYLPMIEMLKSILGLVFARQFQLYFACHESQVEQVKSFAAADKIVTVASNGLMDKCVASADIIILVDDAFNSKLQQQAVSSFIITLTEGLTKTVQEVDENCNASSDLVKVAQFFDAQSKCLVYRKVSMNLNKPFSIVRMSSVSEFSWVSELIAEVEKQASVDGRVWLMCDGAMNGVIGFMNCLLQETAGKYVRWGNFYCYL